MSTNHFSMQQQVRIEVESEFEMTKNNLGDEATAADYAADAVRRLTGVFGL